jgi:hypothetical protein
MLCVTLFPFINSKIIIHKQDSHVNVASKKSRPVISSAGNITMVISITILNRFILQPMKTAFLTPDEFTIQQLRPFSGGTGELSRLLRDIGRAAKPINIEVNKAGLQDLLF